MFTRLTVPFAISAALAAQVPYSGGPFAGVAAGVSLAPGSSLAEDEFWFKDVGFTTSSPHGWSNMFPARPQFTAAALLYDASRPCPTPSGTVDIDAISVGLDWIWADSTGHVLPPSTTNGVWGALAFAVSKGTTGVAQTAVRGEVIRTDSKAGASGDVFTYVFECSTIPSAWIDTTHRALDRSEMGLPANADLDALDLYMPLYLQDPVHYATLPAWAINPTVYFSVSKASLAAVPAAWFAGTGKSGATILQCTWLPGPARYSCPSPLLSYTDLGLQAGDDILALAVERSTTGNLQILLSTQPAAARIDPIVFCEYTPGGSTPVTLYPYTYAGTNDDDLPVSSQLGLLNTDTPMALCGTDPSLYRGLTSNSYAFGTPWQPTGFGCAPQRTLSASAFRTTNSAGVPELKSYMLGWQPANPGPGYAVPLLTTIDFNPFVVPDCSTVFPLPWLEWTGFARPMSTFCGDPIELTIPLPPMSILSGANDLVVLWLAADQTLTSFGSAFPVILSLP